MRTKPTALLELRFVTGIDDASVSELGASVAGLLSDLFLGLHHVSVRSLRRVDWTNSHYIEFVTDINLASFDASHLTRLVFLAHDYCIRVSVEPAAYRYFRFVFHRRQRAGGIFERHPTIEQAVADWRKHYEAEEEEPPQ